jgi:hypothetical protein
MGSGDPGGGGEVEFWRAQAERVAADNVVLRAQIVELKGQVGALAEKVSVLAKLAFGASSEKRARQTPKQTPDRDDPAGGADSGAKPGRGQRKGSGGHGRRDYSHLPTREEIHDLPESERVCPCCGAGYAPFGEETCEQIDWLEAVEPTVPFGLQTQTLVVIWYHLAGHSPKVISEHRIRARWYTTKTHPSYHDMIVKLSRVLIAAQYRADPALEPTPEQIQTTRMFC